MKINTKYHGELEIMEQDLVEFPKGIPGFLEEKKFVLVPFSEDGMFQILQSVKTEVLAFVVTNPFLFIQDYDFKLEQSTVELLEIENREDVLTYVILTVHEQFQETTANLQGPIVINVNKRIGKQVILTGTSYETKHKLFAQLQPTE
ncbi:flagellar assembly protein FliW [Bacillus sp. FJAT-45066]|uniref:flagellar assembly protein FliW n=1 Tax=Bacillus sp. FJAT-45066 TaxID=2011010 RepID=UPI000BB9A57F|nr:flagellar assembly protein FliW [Bacillus sp. FJAT-45066]